MTSRATKMEAVAAAAEALPPAYEHRLQGLEPDNLLAFLALLGLLRALDRVRPAWRARARWDLDRPPLRPALALAEAVTREEISAAADEGVLALAQAYEFGTRLDLNYTGDEAREALRLGPAGSVLDALMSDGALRDDGRIWPTPLCFLFGQGHQHFLDRLAAVPAQAAPPPRGGGRKAVAVTPEACMSECLFAPWERPDKTSGFRWDPAEDRRYALRADDPSGAPAGLQHGANRLAAVGLPVLTGAAILRRGEMRFITRATTYSPSSAVSITWPLWTRNARLSGITALLAHPSLAREVVDLASLTRFGVGGTMRARRVSVGKFFNVTPAERIA